MAKTRKHRSRNTSRRIPRRTKNTLRNIIYAVVIIAAAAAAFDSWRTAASSPVQTAVTTADSLRHVIIPADIPQQIIHYPGFTVSFNPEAHQPNWVAWELTAEEAASTFTSRSSADFAPDPDIDGCAQLADYRRSGYTRGHMAPAADMRWSQQAMDACFLLTNMSPQDNSLNSGAWGRLEERSRAWAMRDSAITIICGPVLTDRLTRTIGKSRIPVPERYFKVIIAPFANPPRGIGFIMPNAKVEGGMAAAATTIDEIEAITGFDFFSTLPDYIENTIEAQSNLPQWNNTPKKRSR
ncbi:MAG: DNA/RNA non-specific endonuclease [Bacteroides sp.]|nr:DNA/RNA non-specific endonuclease [Bacteroides sp.]MCM1456286.1 DNA/RNA non-specific endonuclease [Lachnoclostridium sp.]